MRVNLEARLRKLEVTRGVVDAAGPIVVTLRTLGPTPVQLTWAGLTDLARNVMPGTAGPRGRMAAMVLELGSAIDIDGTHDVFTEEVEAAHKRIQAGEDAAAVLASVVPGLIQQIDDAWCEAGIGG